MTSHLRGNVMSCLVQVVERAGALTIICPLAVDNPARLHAGMVGLPCVLVAAARPEALRQEHGWSRPRLSSGGLCVARMAPTERLRDALLQHGEQWGLGHTGWSDLQGVMRTTYVLAHHKFSGLGSAPRVSAKLDEESTSEQCERQWAEKPAFERHQVAQQFMTKGNPHRADLDKASTGGLPTQVAAAIRG